MGIAVVAFVIVALLGLGYYYSEGVEQSADSVTVAVRGYLSVEQKDALVRQFTGYAPEDGEGNVELNIYELAAAGGSSGVSQMVGKLTTDLRTGGCDLLLVDSDVYQLISNDSLFEDLSGLYPDDPAVTERYRYAIVGKPFSNTAGLDGLPRMYLALRDDGSRAVNKNAQTLERYNRMKKLLDNVVHSTPPEDYAAIGMQKSD